MSSNKNTTQDRSEEKNSHIKNITAQNLALAYWSGHQEKILEAVELLAALCEDEKDFASAILTLVQLMVGYGYDIEVVTIKLRDPQLWRYWYFITPGYD